MYVLEIVFLAALFFTTNDFGACQVLIYNYIQGSILECSLCLPEEFSGLFCGFRSKRQRERYVESDQRSTLKRTITWKVEIQIK